MIHNTVRVVHAKSEFLIAMTTIFIARKMFYFRFLPLKHSPSFLQHCFNISLCSSNVTPFLSIIQRWPYQALPSLQAIRLLASNRKDLPENEDLDVVCRSAFFGCVNQKMPEDVLEEYFSAYGAVDNLYLIKNFRGQSKGYGVVVFRDQVTVDVVLDGTHKIDECVFKAERSRKYRVVKVEGLPQSYSEGEIRELFSQFGDVGKVELHEALEQSQSSGYCLVSFAKQTEVLKAIRNAHNLGGETSNVTLTLLSSMKDYTKLPSKRVIVYNLPYTTTVEELYKHFKFPCPTLREIHLRLDSEHRTCLAFLQFDDAKESDKLVKERTTQFGGREISFKKIDDSRRLNSTDCALFLENIPSEFSRDHVYHHFKNFGRMEKVHVKQNKGFGWVRYYLSPDALVASHDREHVVNGHTIYVRRIALKVPEKGI